MPSDSNHMHLLLMSVLILQKELKETHRKYKQIIARKEKELLWLKQAMRSLTVSINERTTTADNSNSAPII